MACKLCWTSSFIAKVKDVMRDLVKMKVEHLPYKLLYRLFESESRNTFNWTISEITTATMQIY